MTMVSCRKCEYLKLTRSNRICMIPHDKKKSKKVKTSGEYGTIIGCENGKYKRGKPMAREDMIKILKARYGRHGDSSRFNGYTDTQLKQYVEDMEKEIERETDFGYRIRSTSVR